MCSKLSCARDKKERKKERKKLCDKIKMSNQEKISNSSTTKDDDDERVPLPGFRFHPTDEELVGFYLRRKVEKKPICIDLIKHVDIYKHDPWDLPKCSGIGDKEGFFFCRRGRKYRNSVRPNRVTGSGFWKATGIDKPVSSHVGDHIGLKKTLVYYRGSAGKGTKTDWMMHEFRLPTNEMLFNTKNPSQEAEVWTLCWIFKRNATHRKYTPEWRELSMKRQQTMQKSSKACSTTDSSSRENYFSFGAPVIQCNNKKPSFIDLVSERKQSLHIDYQSSSITQLQLPSVASSSTNFTSSSSPYGNNDQLFTQWDWDELRSVVESACDNTSLL